MSDLDQDMAQITPLFQQLAIESDCRLDPLDDLLHHRLLLNCDLLGGSLLLLSLRFNGKGQNNAAALG